jgi:hypothetical protein
VDLRSVLHGRGAWTDPQTGQVGRAPNVATAVVASPEAMRATAHALAYLLRQDEVWTSKLKPPTNQPKGLAVDLVESGREGMANPDVAEALWRQVKQLHREELFSGYQVGRNIDHQPFLRMLVTREDIKRLTGKMTGGA